MLVLHLGCGGFSMELAEEEVYRLRTMAALRDRWQKLRTP